MDCRPWWEEPAKHRVGPKEASVWRCLARVGWPVPFPRMELSDSNSLQPDYMLLLRSLLCHLRKKICTNMLAFSSKIKGPLLSFIFLALWSPGSHVATRGSLLARRWVGLINSKHEDQDKVHKLLWPGVMPRVSCYSNWTCTENTERDKDEFLLVDPVVLVGDFIN